LLLVLAVFFVFSGYLLRWDELGYYSIRVTASIVGYLPVLGGPFERFMLGGGEITSRTLSRFYMWHMFFLPVLGTLLLGFHYYLLKKKRVYAGEVAVILITCGFLMLSSVLYPFELGPKTSPELTTALKPFWLFLWLYTIERGLGLIGPAVNSLNIIVLIAVTLLLLLVPYIDAGAESEKIKKKRRWTGIFFLVLFLALTLAGYLWKPPL
jgi:quinol-cytochrome oxidoreductase complex cytochrome b subunit